MAAAGAAAQRFPDKPLRFVIPFAAGGGSDVMARVIAEPLSQRLGQPVIVDNKPGGNATIGADFVAKSPPDGYTWLHTSPGPQITNPYLMAKLPYDPVKDLTPVARLGTFIAVLVVNPEVPAKTVKELVDMGVIATPSTPDEIARQVESERAKYKRVIETSGVKAE